MATGEELGIRLSCCRAHTLKASKKYNAALVPEQAEEPLRRGASRSGERERETEHLSPQQLSHYSISRPLFHHALGSIPLLPTNSLPLARLASPPPSLALSLPRTPYSIAHYPSISHAQHHFSHRADLPLSSPSASLYSTSTLTILISS